MGCGKMKCLKIAAVAGLSGLLTAQAWASPIVVNEYNAVRPGNPLKSGGSDSYFGAINGNGGDWFELVVVGDGTAGSTVDMRGWTINLTLNRDVSDLDAGNLVLSQDAYWSNVQVGTILTFTQGDSSAVNPEDSGAAFGLNTSINQVNNLATLGYAWTNIFVGDSQYVTATSGVGGDIMGIDSPVTADQETNDDLWFRIYDASSTLLVDRVGENAPGYPSSAGGIGGDEVFRLGETPTTAITAASDYDQDTDSTFGSPNGGQDFSTFRFGAIGIIWDDHNTAGLQDGGAGTWDTTTTRFWDTTLNAGAGGNRAFVSGDDVTFGAGGAGSATINLDADVTVGDLAFQDGTTYTLAGHQLSVNGDIRAFNDATIASNLYPIDNAGNDTEIFTDTGVTLTIAGTLTGPNGFDNVGLGTVRLTGNNAGYQGSIDIDDNSTLRVENDLQTDPGAGDIQVQDAGTLYLASTGHVGNVFVAASSGNKQLITGEAGGTIEGTLDMRDGDAKISGNITVNGDAAIAHAEISPGDSNAAGTLNFNNLALGADANYKWQLFSNSQTGAGTNFDQIAVANNLTQDGTEPLTSGNEVNFGIEFHNDIDLTDSFWSSDHQWVVATVGGTNSLLADHFTIGDVDISDDLTGDNTAIGWAPSFSITTDGNNVFLNWDADGAKIVQWGLIDGFGVFDTDGDWKNGDTNYKWYDGVNGITNAGHVWNSTPGAVDSAIFGSDSAVDEGVGDQYIIVDDSNGAVAVQDITFENNNPHYHIGGDQLTIHGNVRAKISSYFDNDVVLTGDKTFEIGKDADGSDATVQFSGAVTGDANITSIEEGYIRFSGDASGFTGDVTLQDQSKLAVDAGRTLGAGNVYMNSGEVTNGEITGAGTLAGNVVITDGDGKLSGSLHVQGMTTVVKGTLSPGSDNTADGLPDGNTAGELHLEGGLALGQSADYTWQLFSNSETGAGTNFDHVAVTGAVTADTSLPPAAGGLEVNIDIELRDAADRTAGFWDSNHTWSIISTTGGFDSSLNSSLFTIRDLLDTNGDDLFTVDPTFADRFSLAINGDDLQLMYMVASSYIDGDLNGDGTVDATDLNLILLNWGTDGLPSGWLATGQLDGTIDAGELNLVLLNWGAQAGGGSSLEVTPIPEPTTFALLGLGGLVMFRRRRRSA